MKADHVVSRRSALVVLGGAATGVSVAGCKRIRPDRAAETAEGWVKEREPVVGGDLGTCFDASALHENDRYRLWFSWRPRRSIALVESIDGVHWTSPIEVLGPSFENLIATEVNRPTVIRTQELYHMWYTSQTETKSQILHATSRDGVTWAHAPGRLVADLPWEKGAVMSPHVLWDSGIFRMWYCGGGQYEPEKIGYCESLDGVAWIKEPDPIFGPDAKASWDTDRVGGPAIVKLSSEYIMFYIGFRDVHTSAICIAKSPDGKSRWTRHPANPIISAGSSYFSWDRDAVYKATPILLSDGWIVWFNGRAGTLEQIGLARRSKLDLGF